MTQHYRLMQSDPSAIILAKNPQTGSLEETKIYKNRGNHGEDIIYLSDKQTFAFKFFNPLQEKIGIKITMNGNLDDNILIINPGQSIVLERFLNESRKMIFETYKIDKTNPAAVKAIENNGDIKIEFFKEKNYQYQFNSNFSYPCSGAVYDASINEMNCLSNDMTYTSNINCNLNDELETGRVEKGNNSNQNLEKVEIEFKTTPFLTQYMKLMPESQAKTYESTEIRNYCHQCGYRIRNKSWLYCPKCGNKI